MSTFPDDLLYSREHMWVRVDGNIATIGMTDYGQEQMGEIVSIKLPAVDSSVDQDEPFGTIESARTAADLVSPISGDIINVNDDLADDVGIINSDPYDMGWMIVVEMSNLNELDDLLDSYEYADYVEEDMEAD
ncbi:MAG: glycine cleavage system protein GcvH [Deltaproteobacteria bacterium]|nr:glycine cleavage system protein GcvH [Deltaproteobacteria bacterium]